MKINCFFFFFEKPDKAPGNLFQQRINEHQIKAEVQCPRISSNQTSNPIQFFAFWASASATMLHLRFT